MTKATGYAAVDYTGLLLVATVSATKRAAMVNWLVACDRQAIYNHHTDEEIERWFIERAHHRGVARLAKVKIEVVE